MHRPHLEGSLPTISSTTASHELAPQIGIVLLSSSTFERFKTTKQHTQIGHLRSLQIFNASVGEDKTENVP